MFTTARPALSVSIALRVWLPVFCAWAVFQSSASGFMRKEDYQMSLGLTSSVIYDSNLRRNADEESDTVFRIQPKVEFAKPRGFVRGLVGAGVNVVRYLDAIDNDNENLVLLAEIDAGEVFGEGSPIQVRTEFEQTNDSDGLTGELTRRETYVIGVDGRHRFGFGGGVFSSYDYRFLRSRTAGFSDVDTRSWRAGGFYQRGADSFVLELDFERERSESDGGLETVNNIISGGIRGPLISTLSGSVRLGVQENESEGGGLSSERVPFYEIALNWRYSALMSFDLSGERRFVTDSNDRSRDQSRLELRVRRQLGGPWLAEMGLRYVENRFQAVGTPSGNATENGVFVGVDYALSDWGAVGWRFELDESRSSEETLNYQAHRFGVELSARF